MSSQEEGINLPPTPDEPNDTLKVGCRLWIGNLDNRITEFSLLKLLQKYGQLSKFDFLCHKTGPDQGKPRGYCFVTYGSREDAERAKSCLNGKLALSKRLVVKDANTNFQNVQDVRNRVMLPNNPVTKNDARSKKAQIRAIETKLHLMKQDLGPVIAGASGTTAGCSGNNIHKNQSHIESHRSQGHSQSRSYSQGHRQSGPYVRDKHR